MKQETKNTVQLSEKAIQNAVSKGIEQQKLKETMRPACGCFFFVGSILLITGIFPGASATGTGIQIVLSLLAAVIGVILVEKLIEKT